MNVDLAFAAFAVVALAVFGLFRPAVSVLIVFLGGWLLLPIGHYPVGAASAVFPYWITGLAVPSDMLLTKAWVAPAAALLGVVAFDRRALCRLRPHWIDAPLVLACVWPCIASAFIVQARPGGLVASLYLIGCWGLPWCLGRLYFSSTEGLVLLAKALALSAIACLPFSLVEGWLGPTLYGSAYETHPFRFDGDVRYLGFRPIGFFEHGNQFGLWVSLGTLAALWLARTAGARQAPASARRLWHGIAAVTLAMTVAAQSVGALVLLGVGAGLLWLCRFVSPRRMVAGGLALLVVGGSVYVSGVIPVTRIAKETALGQHVLGGLRGIGRGSFGWRISQDQKLLADATSNPLTGTGRWDWWADKRTRPWGLWLLLAGQFGLVEMLLLATALLWPAGRVARSAPRASGWLPAGLPLMLATLALLAVIDALLNSFVYFPAILIAGSLALPPADR